MREMRFGTKLRLVRAMLMLALAVGLSSCALFDCANTVISESPSPSGQLLAVVFERDCGATTGTNTQICFRRSTEPFEPEKQPSFLVFEGDGRVSLSWKTPAHLVIRLPPDAKVFQNESEASGIKIEYVVK